MRNWSAAIDEKYETFWPRFGAALLDSAALSPVLWIDQIVWNTTYSAPVLIVWSVLANGTSLVYFIGFLYRYGQTPGKMATGVIVLSHSGGTLSLSQAILRHIVEVLVTLPIMIIVFANIAEGELTNRGMGSLIYFSKWFVLVLIGWQVLELVTMLFNSQRRAIHDLIAGTVVVRQPIPERIGNFRILRWVLIVALLAHLFIPRILPESNIDVSKAVPTPPNKPVNTTVEPSRSWRQEADAQ